MSLRVLLAILPFLILAGCKTVEPIVQNAPAAQTPSNVNVLAVLQPGSPFVNVGATNGIFEILPGGLPSQGFQLFFNAPYPASLRVMLDSDELPRFEAITGGTNPAVTGYYRINNINPNQTPTAWRISVRPPNSKLASLSYTVSVFNVSINPNFPVGTAQHESAPFVMMAGAQKIYALTTMTTGDGNGRITSTPGNVNCGIDCIAMPGQSTTYTLTATAASGSTFAGWTSSCTPPSVCNCPATGSRLSCSITLNGTAATATALFTRSGTPLSCPSPRATEGFNFVGQPSCASFVIDQHPSIALACDNNGYFCCESVTGANSSRCGGSGKSEASADCRAFGNTVGPLQGPPFDGCYSRVSP
jgi:hypothetical protein